MTSIIRVLKNRRPVVPREDTNQTNQKERRREFLDFQNSRDTFKHNTIQKKKFRREGNSTTMGFLGIGRRRKSDAEKEEEERARKANMPWYARLFGTECCGNRGRKKDEKRNDGATASD